MDELLVGPGGQTTSVVIEGSSGNSGSSTGIAVTLRIELSDPGAIPRTAMQARCFASRG
jgi:hypothetical protein